MSQATKTADPVQKAIEQDSRSWVNGAKLRQLSNMRKMTTALRKEKILLVGIVATPNRFASLRAYHEDIARR